MQQKLDNLCEQVNSSKENSPAATKDSELKLDDEAFGTEKIKFVDCGCWHCERHSPFFNESMVRIPFCLWPIITVNTKQLGFDFDHLLT